MFGSKKRRMMAKEAECKEGINALSEAQTVVRNAMKGVSHRSRDPKKIFLVMTLEDLLSINESLYEARLSFIALRHME